MCCFSVIICTYLCALFLAQRQIAACVKFYLYIWQSSGHHTMDFNRSVLYFASIRWLVCRYFFIPFFFFFWLVVLISFITCVTLVNDVIFHCRWICLCLYRERDRETDGAPALSIWNRDTNQGVHLRPEQVATVSVHRGGLHRDGGLIRGVLRPA